MANFANLKFEFTRFFLFLSENGPVDNIQHPINPQKNETKKFLSIHDIGDVIAFQESYSGCEKLIMCPSTWSEYTALSLNIRERMVQPISSI